MSAAAQQAPSQVPAQAPSAKPEAAAAPTVPAQSATQPAQTNDLRDTLPPSAIYEQTMQPFDAVRANIANWSDTEQAALAVVIRIASSECQRLERTPVDGEELLSLARLCATGLDWPGAYSAATRYIRDDKALHLVMGYQIAVQADLNLQGLGDVVTLLKDLTKRVPYKDDVDATFRYAIYFTDVPQPKIALMLQQVRQPYLLEAIRAKEFKSGDVPSGAAEAYAVHLLELLRFNDVPPEQVEQAKATLDAAVTERTQTLSAADAYQIAVARRRYGMIGKQLPVLQIAASTYEKPFRQNATGIRLLVVYPQNCVSCANVPKMVDGVRGRLHADAEAWAVEDASGLNAAIAGQKPDGTHYLITTSALLDEVGANGTPFFVITDKNGNVGFLAPGTPDWLVLKGAESTAEIVMDRVANYGYEEK